MTRRSRRYIFYLFAALFLPLGLYLVAYSSGIVFDIVNAEIERTGGIFIKSNTPRISVSLDGHYQKFTSRITGGALLTNIEPGEHFLRVEKPGYNPWSKGIRVEPMLVTELRNILLVATSTKIASSTNDEIRLITATTSPRYDFILKNDGRLVQQLHAASSTTVLKDIAAYRAIGPTLWAVNNNGFIIRVDPNSGDIQTIGRPGFYSSDSKPIRFVDSPAGEIAIIDSAGGVFIIDEQNQITPVAGNALNVSFDEAGEKMILHEERRIDVLWRRDGRYQPFQKKGERETILMLASSIHNAQWYHGDAAHVVFRTNEGIYFTELDGRGGRNTFELVTGPTEDLITNPEFPNAIFFKRDNGYFKIEL